MSQINSKICHVMSWLCNIFHKYWTYFSINPNNNYNLHDNTQLVMSCYVFGESGGFHDMTNLFSLKRLIFNKCNLVPRGLFFTRLLGASRFSPHIILISSFGSCRFSPFYVYLMQYFILRRILHARWTNKSLITLITFFFLSNK